MPTKRNDHGKVFVNGNAVQPINKVKLPPGKGWEVVREKQREAAKK